MNTPAHLILNAVVLGRGSSRKLWTPIALGALLPDLPMFGFYLYQRLFVGSPEHLIWSELYFTSHWQAFFDVFNSLPIIGLLALVAWRARSPWWLACLASMALHCVADLPLHREDAHAHFYPISSWHFVSPVSYWDPRHHGDVFLSIELLGMLLGAAVLWRREPAWRWLGVICVLIHLIFAAFAIVVWLAAEPTARAAEASGLHRSRGWGGAA